MKKFHHLSIDGDLLQTFITIYAEKSISKAAVQLEQSQSTLSHRLERLRSIVGDPLFVRAGRKITPTERAQDMIDDAKQALACLRSLTEAKTFDPAVMTDRFVIAATDYERALFLIEAYKRILSKAPQVRISFMWEKYANSEALRKGLFDLTISPIEDSNEQDIRKRKLIDETVSCFFDSEVISPPDTLEAFIAANHVRVIFSESDISFVDGALQLIGRSRNISLDMPSISELPRTMRGTNLVATLPSRLRHSIMREFSHCTPPFKIGPLTYSLFWHERTHNSPKHNWLRQQIIEAANEVAK